MRPNPRLLSKFGLLAPQHDHYGSDHYQDEAWINGIKGRPFRANIGSPHLATIENMTDYQRNADDSQYGASGPPGQSKVCSNSKILMTETSNSNSMVSVERSKR